MKLLMVKKIPRVKNSYVYQWLLCISLASKPPLRPLQGLAVVHIDALMGNPQKNTMLWL